MNHFSKFLLVPALAGAILFSAPPSSHAQQRPTAQPTGIDRPTEQRALGVAGAIGCGFGIRASIVTGGNPIVVAFTVVMCLMALADGLTSIN